MGESYYTALLEDSDSTGRFHWFHCRDNQTCLREVLGDRHGRQTTKRGRSHSRGTRLRIQGEEEEEQGEEEDEQREEEEEQGESDRQEEEPEAKSRESRIELLMKILEEDPDLMEES